MPIFDQATPGVSARLVRVGRPGGVSGQSSNNLPQAEESLRRAFELSHDSHIAEQIQQVAAADAGLAAGNRGINSWLGVGYTMRGEKTNMPYARRAFFRNTLTTAIVLTAVFSTAAIAQDYQPSPENLQARREFQDMKFGMFMSLGRVQRAGRWRVGISRATSQG